MRTTQTLNQYLEAWSGNEPGRGQIAAIILSIAKCGITLSKAIARQRLELTHFAPGEIQTAAGADKPLRSFARDLFEGELRQAPVLAVSMEDSGRLAIIDRQAPQIVAIDPLDSASNVETNLCAGSVFSILTASEEELYLQPLGAMQQAAGFLQFGPRTMLVLSCGAGTEIFILDPITRLFVQSSDRHRIPDGIGDFALDYSNYLHWDNSIRAFIDDCLIGEDGPLGADCDFHWAASLVADSYRILTRGGIFLDPGNSRPGLAQGRFRLLHAAAPLAMLLEQAGGTASDGSIDILQLKLAKLSQRVPLIFGSAAMVGAAVEYISGASAENTHFPLFEHRSLFRN